MKVLSRCFRSFVAGASFQPARGRELAIHAILSISYYESYYIASCSAQAQASIVRVGERANMNAEKKTSLRSTENALTILEVNGPFREPREHVFSYDYSIQRSTWATPHGIRVKVSIPDELETFKKRLQGMAAGSPGQQLLMSNILSRTIADWKMKIADEEGLLDERRDVMLDPFVGPLSHLFMKLDTLFEADRVAVREELRRRVGM